MGRAFNIIKEEMRKTTAEIKLPTRATARSAGYDFYAPESVLLLPGTPTIVWTDVKASMQEDEVLLLYARSSMGKNRIVLANGTGIIDSDYFENEKNDGNIGIMLLNMGSEAYQINAGDRIAQGVFTRYLVCDQDNTDTQRKGGFGSTDTDKSRESVQMPSILQPAFAPGHAHNTVYTNPSVTKK